MKWSSRSRTSAPVEGKRCRDEIGSTDDQDEQQRHRMSHAPSQIIVRLTRITSPSSGGEPADADVALVLQRPRQRGQHFRERAADQQPEQRKDEFECGHAPVAKALVSQCRVGRACRPPSASVLRRRSVPQLLLRPHPRHFLDDLAADFIALGGGDEVAAGVAERFEEGEVPQGEALRRVGRLDPVVEQTEDR